MKWSLIILLFTSIFLVSCSEKSQPGRVNVLFISVDDLRPELGAYGVEAIKTPHLDSLAGRATLFTRAYCQSPICMPSRASLLTGIVPEHFKPSGELDAGPADALLPNIKTLPGHFQEHGYETVSIGKIYHHNRDDSASWTRRYTHTFDEGNGYCSGYQNPEYLKRVSIYMNAWSNPALMDSVRPPAVEKLTLPDSLTPDGKTTQFALQELRQFAESDTPFFLAVGYYRPHLPFTAPEKYWDLYNREEMEPAENNFSPRNGLGHHDWNELRRYGDIPREGPLTDEKARELVHGYYASVSFIDAQIGKILHALKTLNLENTLIVVWGDHGWNLREHGLWCKHSHFEVSTRTALIIQRPGQQEGMQTDALTGLIDLYPTCSALAGLPIPGHVEGEDLTPLLTGDTSSVRAAIFSHYFNSYSMRTDRYRFNRFFKPQPLRNSTRDQTGVYELYDHQIDPEENTNLAYAPGYDSLVLALDQQMLKNGYLSLEFWE